jgi:hypothetical protein
MDGLLENFLATSNPDLLIEAMNTSEDRQEHILKELQDLIRLKTPLLKPLLFYCNNTEIAATRRYIERTFRESYGKVFSDLNSSKLLELFDQGYMNASHCISKLELIQLLAIYKQSALFSISHWSSGSNIINYAKFLNDGTCYCIHPKLTNSLLVILEKLLERNRMLPPSSFRLDNISFMLTPNITSAASSYWHKDAVGHAIRLFIILKAQGATPTTKVISKSNTLPTHGIYLDSIRAFYPYLKRKTDNLSTPQPQAFEDLIEYSLSNGDPDKVRLLNQDTGSIAGWDFNTFHKAVIPADSGRSNNGHRLAIVLDFMDPESSDFITNYNLAPCGPGQIPIYFAEEPRSTFIDAKHVHKVSSNLFIYSTRPRINHIIKSCGTTVDF